MSPARLSRVRASVTRTARWLAQAYALDIEADAGSFLMHPHEARTHVATEAGEVPRWGLLALEEGGELLVAIYLDAEDADDPAIVLEETSHWLCLAWHAAHDLPVSPLVLELQADVDRFLYDRLAGRDPLAHLGSARLAEWVGPAHRGRYVAAHAAAGRYCRALSRRYPKRRDTPALFGELRRFYRASPQTKLRAAA